LIRVLPFGDAGVLVAVDRDDVAEQARTAAALALMLGESLPARAGWARPSAGIGGVLVSFDPLRLDADAAVQVVQRLVHRGNVPAPPARAARPVVEIPVRYGGDDGPDLDDVAAAVGLGAAELVRLHADREYEALALGFLPGFAYLGPLPPALVAIGRRPTPRTHVDAGSVALAGGMTAVYPVGSPGGWHVIGRTDTAMWRPGEEPPNLLMAGDRVRFVPTEEAA
jgi:KipI family sensor histidine kinase inhibitor